MQGKNLRNSPNSQNHITFLKTQSDTRLSTHTQSIRYNGIGKRSRYVEDQARGPSWSVNFRASQNDCRMRRSSNAIRAPDAIRKRRRKHSYQTPSRSLSRRRQSRTARSPSSRSSKTHLSSSSVQVRLSAKLFDFNVNAVSGYIAMNTDALIHTVMEGGAFRRCARTGAS